MLTHAVTGAFEHPNKTLFLYDEVRSAAVHGGIPVEIDDATTRGFRSTLTRTLKHYLTYAQTEAVTTRKGPLKRLKNHPDKAGLVAWLRENGGPTWSEYLAGVESGK
jgi:hypothetical protein